LPGVVDFLGPDRLALYHTTPSPTFVVLDVTKGTPTVTAPLPANDFSAEHDHLNPRNDFSSYRVHPTSGAVSPGRKLIALGGRTNIILVEADGWPASCRSSRFSGGGTTWACRSTRRGPSCGR
jgi:hypothetical protein